MIYLMVSVRDRAANAFANPFVVPTEAMAVRSFTDEVNRRESPMFAHPDDYDLYIIGQYEDASGLLEACAPRMLVAGKSVFSS